MAQTGRPAKGGQSVYVRLPEETLSALDAHLETLQGERPGMSGITRSDLIRDLLVKAVAELRRLDAAPPAPAKKAAKR